VTGCDASRGRLHPRVKQAHELVTGGETAKAAAKNIPAFLHCDKVEISTKYIGLSFAINTIPQTLMIYVVAYF
jgi:hypothetical protein